MKMQQAAKNRVWGAEVGCIQSWPAAGAAGGPPPEAKIFDRFERFQEHLRTHLTLRKHPITHHKREPLAQSAGQR